MFLSVFLSTHTESELKKEIGKKSQLIKLKQNNLNLLYDAVAEQRTCLALKENAKNENCLRKIMAEDLVERAIFIRDRNRS